MKLKRILVPVLIISLLVISGITFFNKSTTDYFKGWRSVNFGKEKQAYETSVIPYSFYEHEYNGAYVKNDTLHFFSSSTGNMSTFPERYPIFNFTFSPIDSTMFYVVIIEDSLMLKTAVFMENTVRITDILALSKHKNEFLDPINECRAGIRVLHDTVLIETGFSEESKQFESTLAFIPGEELRVLSVDDFINRRAIELIELQQNEEKKFMENIMLVKLKGFSDLHLMMNRKPVALKNYHAVSDRKVLNDSLFIENSNDLKIIEDSIQYISSW